MQLLFFHFRFRNQRSKITEKTAAAIPPAAALTPPVKAPTIPDCLTPSIAPFSQIVAKTSQRNSSTSTSEINKILINTKTTQNSTSSNKITKIRAGVSLVLSIKIWPITQISPPTTKHFKRDGQAKTSAQFKSIK